MVKNILKISLLLAQNEAQKTETFILLAVFALMACIMIFSLFAKNPFTSEKAIKKPLIVISLMAIFVFFVIFLIMKYNN